ncbi:hypothetical protein CYLTODRAFT_487346 [Cylindrobasidium torrendii FP15055 ss-10]|uniref:DUF6697 domain-containing protein n=1 Tax=Cylindrobasidium torrendii FP15055 ss-10 TaxID=1314674 RepID=A0A0D7BNX8_9AGAR|nr:hypothetical protein CYLTODRAFT_487346 [Cylindrobasidium torrendii FP15055 ss-10]
MSTIFSSPSLRDTASFKPPSYDAQDAERTVEFALAVAGERKKVVDALAARDAAVRRLADVCDSLREKIDIIERLKGDPYEKDTQLASREAELSLTQSQLASAHAELSERQAELGRAQDQLRELKETITGLKLDAAAQEETIRGLREELKDRQAPFENTTCLDAPFALRDLTTSSSTLVPPPFSRNSSAMSVSSVTTENHSVRPAIKQNSDDLDYAITRINHQPTPEAEYTILQRNKLLGDLPLPPGVPEDTLRPIVLPPSLTFHDLISSSPSLRGLLSNYKVLQQLTTSWCPDREEHGYMLIPAFKCTTNPRVTTAHRWTSVDVMARMNKPTECFYNRDGTWYYAGVYMPFRLDDLTIKEWEVLSNETIQSIIKETLSARKNISPQNVYEVSQLYAAGALKVACIGMQCVGFNRSVYDAVLQQADRTCAGADGNLSDAMNGMKLGR